MTTSTENGIAIHDLGISRKAFPRIEDIRTVRVCLGDAEKISDGDAIILDGIRMTVVSRGVRFTTWGNKSGKVQQVDFRVAEYTQSLAMATASDRATCI